MRLQEGKLTVSLHHVAAAVGAVFTAGVYLGFFSRLEWENRRDQPVGSQQRR